MADFDIEAGSTYIYPTNYPMRNYQFEIVKEALLKNTLVCLPTGLGKTFIGAVVMYNFFRWYPTGKIVFLAPTRPLVAQQIEACFNVMGIPQECTVEMTGTTAPETRRLIWQTKRVFFLTPQVLMNDLSRESCPLQSIKLIVIDEAHKALGNHAYCQVMKQLKQQCHEFRILALSATPGSDMNAIQQVVSNLMISHIELRNEESPDITQYTHVRSIEKVVISIEGELKRIADEYLKIVKYYVFKLINSQVLYTKDETTVTKFQLLKAREGFRQNPPDNSNRQTVGMLEGTFALCITLYHAYELLLMHGIRSFFNFLNGSIEQKKVGFHGKSELSKNPALMELLRSIETKYMTSQLETEAEGSTSTTTETPRPGSSKSLISHPKMEKLQQILLEHFLQHRNEDHHTRVMIFSQYRDSVAEITLLLRTFEPLIKPMSFVGQSSKGGKGITQKEQIRVVKEFRSGNYNTLVSTCVGEEGLDIGEVDLIVCYDAPKSPIRLVQRMGRTGRKRDGKIIVLVTQGKEEKAYLTSQYQKKALTKALLKGDRLAKYLFPNSPRMVPYGIDPVCLKLQMTVSTYKVASKGERRPRRSIVSYLTSASEKKVDKSLLNETEAKVFEERYKIDSKFIPKIPKASFGLAKTKLKGDISSAVDEERRRLIDVGEFQPWNTTLQKVHRIPHAQSARNLVHLTEFINLQVMIGDNDNYSLEMAPFLDKKYLLQRNVQSMDTVAGNVNEKRASKSRLDTSNVKPKRRSMKSIKGIKKGGKVSSNTSMKKGMKSFLLEGSSLKGKKRSSLDHTPASSCVNQAQVPVWSPTKCEVVEEESVTFLLNDSTDADYREFDLSPKLNSKRERGKKPDDQEGLKRLEDVFRSFSPSKEKRKVSFQNPPKFEKTSLIDSIPRPCFLFEMILKVKIDRSKVHQSPVASISKPSSQSHSKAHQSSPLYDWNHTEVEEEWMPSPVTDADKNNASVKPCEVLEDLLKTPHKKSSTKDNIQNLGDNTSGLVSSPHFSSKHNQPTLEKESNTDGKHLNNTSCLLTPPPGTKDKSDASPETNQPSHSPFFASKRPVWSKHSPAILSSTPIIKRSKILFGNSSVNITPISLNVEQKFASPKVSPFQRGQDSTKGSEKIEPKGLSIDKGKSTDQMPLKEFSKRPAMSNDDVNFELSIDDDLFAAIDLESIVRKADDEKALRKGGVTAMKGTGDKTHSGLSTNVVDSCHSQPKDESKPSILSVTQIIDFVNEPQHKNKPVGRVKSVTSTTNGCDSKFKETDWAGHERGSNSRKSGNILKESQFIHENPILSQQGGSSTKRKLYHPLNEAKDCLETWQEKGSNIWKKDESIDAWNEPFIPTATGCRQNDKERSSTASISCQGKTMNHVHDKPPQEELTVQFDFGLDGFEEFHPQKDVRIPFPKSNNRESAMDDSDDMFADLDWSREMEWNNDVVEQHLAKTENPKSLPLNTFIRRDGIKGSNDEVEQKIAKTELPKSLLPNTYNLLDDLLQPSKPYKIDSRQHLTKKEEYNTSITQQRLETKPQSSNYLTGTQSKVPHSPLTPQNESENSSDDSVSILDDSPIVCRKKAKVNVIDDSPIISRKKSEANVIDDSPIIRRKKAKVNVIDDSNDQTILNARPKNSSRETSSISNGSHFMFSDDDDFDLPISTKSKHRPEIQQRETKIRRKRKIGCLVNLEASVADDSVVRISSDESETSLDGYDSSFVDDDVPLTQQQEQQSVDMQAVYLRSVRSPLKNTVEVGRRTEQRQKILDQTLDDFHDEEEEEDSFVVENDFVEYETQFLGDTMMELDPIIQQAIEDKGKETRLEKRQKRRRIVRLSGSSDDEQSPDPKKTKIESTPLKAIASVSQRNGDDSFVLRGNVQEVSSPLRGNVKDVSPLQGNVKEVSSPLQGNVNEVSPLRGNVKEVSPLQGNVKEVLSPLQGAVKEVSLPLRGNVREVSSVPKRNVNVSSKASFSRETPVPESKPDLSSSMSGFVKRAKEVPSDDVPQFNLLPPDDFLSQSNNNDVFANKTLTKKSERGEGCPKWPNTDAILSKSIIKDARQEYGFSKSCNNDTGSGSKDLRHQVNCATSPKLNSKRMFRDKALSLDQRKDGNTLWRRTRSEEGWSKNSPENSSAPAPKIAKVVPSIRPPSSISFNPFKALSTAAGKCFGKVSEVLASTSSTSSSTGLSPTTSSTTGNSVPERHPIDRINTSSVEAVPAAKPSNSARVWIMVDTTEVSIAGIISSTLRLQYGAQTYVTQVSPASYVVSTRLAVFRQNYTSFVNSVNRSRLVDRFRNLLKHYERVVVIVEKDAKLKSSQLPPRTHYLDSIACACAQLPQLKVFFSSDQDETSEIIWHLARQERHKGCSIPQIPVGNSHFEQAVKFYRSLPRVSSTSAVLLALNFPTVKAAINSDVEQLRVNGSMAREVATFLKTFFTRKFRKDFLPSSFKDDTS